MMRLAVWRLAAFLAATPAASWAGAMPMLDLPPGSFRHELATSMHLNGVGLRAQVFDVAGHIDDVMPQIVMQFDPPLRALPHGEGWMLVPASDAGWIVVLSPRRQRTFAVLSSLDHRVRHVPRQDAPAWLPPGTEQRMVLRASDQGRVSTQQVFSHPSLSASDLARQVFRRLGELGWAVAGLPQTASSHWIRGNEEISLSFVPAAGGSGMFAVTRQADAFGRPGDQP